jgi:hypothetical protein
VPTGLSARTIWINTATIATVLALRKRLRLARHRQRESPSFHEYAQELADAAEPVNL